MDSKYDDKEFLINEFMNALNIVETENGAYTNRSSKSNLLNFYMLAGAMRYRSESDLIELFDKAKAEDKIRALKCVFYLGDIREGQGERRAFNSLIKHIAKEYPEMLEQNINLIPFYNRWDSVCSLFDTPLEKNVMNLIKRQFDIDMKSDVPSLMAKWLPSINASSKEKNKMGIKIAKQIKLAGNKSSDIKNIIYYRKELKILRDRLNIVESKMCKKEFDKIIYENLPSVAAKNYSEAFVRNDKDRYMEYINNLAEGKAKVNSAALFPYKIIEEIFRSPYKISAYKKMLLQKQWDSLPNYITNEDVSGIVVADVSGSMHGDPMNVAISLALYMAEKIEGPYKNKFITFSNRPQLVEIIGDSLIEKVRNISRADWDMNTNIEKVFDLILNTAVENNLPQNSIPNYLYIISDMEFDKADVSNTNRNTLFKIIKNKFDLAGYDMPKLVFWNVEARQNQSPMTIDQNGWMGVSGLSATIFKALMNNEFIEVIERSEEEKAEKGQQSDAEELMKFVLDSERYKLIKI